MKDYPTLRQRKMMGRRIKINSDVVAYFRGQFLVCLVDGIRIGAALTMLGLNLAAVTAQMTGVLTMIPYIGIIICWVPAVLIAAFQWPHLYA